MSDRIFYNTTYKNWLVYAYRNLLFPRGPDLYKISLKSSKLGTKTQR